MEKTSKVRSTPSFATRAARERYFSKLALCWRCDRTFPKNMHECPHCRRDRKKAKQ